MASLSANTKRARADGLRLRTKLDGKIIRPVRTCIKNARNVLMPVRRAQRGLRENKRKPNPQLLFCRHTGQCNMKGHHQFASTSSACAHERTTHSKCIECPVCGSEEDSGASNSTLVNRVCQLIPLQQLQCEYRDNQDLFIVPEAWKISG